LLLGAFATFISGLPKDAIQEYIPAEKLIPELLGFCGERKKKEKK
jgi:hypothetical protein